MGAGRPHQIRSRAGRLRLRPPLLADEAACLTAHQQMWDSDRFPFLLGYEHERSWADHLEILSAQRHGQRLPTGWVPTTFLVADVDGAVIGRTSIRHELNDFLLREGGHIGYGVLPDHRRRGYATEILRQSLDVARAVGVRRVLVTCDDDNVASARTIERCGGALESTVETTAGPPKRRYWID